jgi:hypothetical protein
MLVEKLGITQIQTKFILLSLSKESLIRMLTHCYSLKRFLDVALLNNLDEGKSSYTKKNILDKNVFVDDVQSFSKSFSDSGLFGLKLAGSASHVLSIVILGQRNRKSWSQSAMLIEKYFIVGFRNCKGFLQNKNISFADACIQQKRVNVKIIVLLK